MTGTYYNIYAVFIVLLSYYHVEARPLSLRLLTFIDLNDSSTGSYGKAGIGCQLNATQFTYLCEGYGSLDYLSWHFMTPNNTKYKEIKTYFVQHATWNYNNTDLRKTVNVSDHYRVTTVLIQDRYDKQCCKHPVLVSTLTIQKLSEADANIPGLTVKCTIESNTSQIDKTAYHGITTGMYWYPVYDQTACTSLGITTVASLNTYNLCSVST